MKEKSKSRNKNSTCHVEDRVPEGFLQWIDYYQKNKPQTNALAAGIMVTIYGGQQLAWGIFNGHLQAQPWAGGYEDDGTVFWAIISWFIAAIVGFLAASVIANRFTKMSIYVFASVLSGISAGLLIANPGEHLQRLSVESPRGFSHGIVYVTVLIHASEVAIARLRGMVIATIHLCLIIGVFTTSSSLLPVYETRSYAIDPTKTIGLNGLICIVTGLVLAFFLNRESPVFLIRKYREDEAVEMMIRLRSESHETTDIRREINEFKLMVMEDAKNGWNIFDSQNRWPLFVVVLMKLIFVASFNMPLNLVWLEATGNQLYDGNTDPSGMCLSGLRWIVIMIMMFLIDFNRIKLYILSSVASSGFLVVLIYILRVTGDGSDGSLGITVLAFLFQMTSGVAVGILADAYAAEAFNTKKKPMSIAFASSVEFLFQIFMVASFYYLKIPLQTMIGGLAVVMGLGAFAYKVPDTSNMSLRNARDEFVRL